jgi:hypothetical protein
LICDYFFCGWFFAFLQGFLQKAGAFAWFLDGEFVVERAELWGFDACFSVMRNMPHISSLFLGFSRFGNRAERLSPVSILYSI